MLCLHSVVVYIECIHDSGQVILFQLILELLLLILKIAAVDVIETLCSH